MKTELELAYICGLFDGEGCISLSKREKGRSQKYHEYPLKIELKMTDRNAVERIYKFFDKGYFHSKQGTKNEKNRQQWIWHIEKKSEVKEILKELSKYCVVKQKEIIIALEFLKIPNLRGISENTIIENILRQREECYIKLGQAKRKEYLD